MTEALGSWLWLENSGLSQSMRQLPWLYPLVEIAHIFGFALLLGTLFGFDLRLLGWGRRLSVADLAGHLLPWAHVSFVLVLGSGFLLFATDPAQLAVNPAFRLKLGLIVLAGLNAAAFYAGPFRSLPVWGREGVAPGTARLVAVISLGLWSAVLVCGRLIAYF